MKSTNTYLQSAKSNKNDEFYTTYEGIQKELKNYKEQLKGKIVYCNTDNPFKSNFCKFFIKNFNDLELKRLICTSYSGSSSTEPKRGLLLDIEKVDESLARCSYSEILRKLGIKELNGSGSFDSEECIEFLKQSDIVITNPPFSQFRNFISLLVKFQKKFLIIGNMNAITYKEIFPLIKNNKAWLGYNNGEMAFRVPNDSEPRNTRFWIDETGQKWRSLGNAMWLTNLDVAYRHKLLDLNHTYDPEKYPYFDNYNAINISRVAEIPNDFFGIMAVPLTILTKYNPEQFEIIGEANHGSDNPYDLFKPVINGKEIFKRILIRKKVQSMNFNILDLFCGAGGFSYGLHKNRNFKTVVALDFNEKAAETFKNNMPDTKVIVGDISDTEIKKLVIEESKKRKVNMIIGGPPCQGFSLKGKKLGLNDPRNFLFLEYLSIVKVIQPELFVIENVKSLLSTSAGWFKNEIVKTIEEMGYRVEVGVLNASNFGVPQSRERAIFICSKNIKIPLPVGNKNIVTVREAIGDLSYLESGEGAFEQDYLNSHQSEYQKMMRKGSDKLYNHQASNHKKIAIDKLKMIPPEKGREYLPKELIGKQKFKSTWGRLVWDEVSPTIDTRFDAASNGKNNHPYLNRAITPREAARIQSFDDSFVFYGSKVYIRQQIGNAVPPLMAKGIADQIERVLKNER